MVTHTFTRTHVVVPFANPHLVCGECREPIDAFHDMDACGCRDSTSWNRPCRHVGGALSLCPSWSPVDGCTCPGDHSFNEPQE